MSTLEFGIFDSFGPFEMEEFPTVVEVYEAHMREAQRPSSSGTATTSLLSTRILPSAP